MIIDTPLGKIKGTDKAGVVAFRGIRYAQASVGNLRFCPPIAVPPWSGIYDASTFGAAAPQVPNEQGPVEECDEDCLFLNVYTPAADDQRRPVLFWIHGGGYVSGSGRVYNGRPFVTEQGVVVVTINYRMGALGYLHVGHLDSSLNESVNNGILDQICALQWVRDNIGAFGGDPGNITIFGESAGGTATAMLLGCPRVEGLFHKAIVHSPHVDLIPVGEGHEAFTNRCIERLGGDPGKNGLETLRNASVEALTALQMPDPDRQRVGPNLAIRKPDNVGFSPAIDGNLIPRPVAETIRQRGPANVPIMGGGCRHEGTLFANIVGNRDYTEPEAIELMDREGFDGKSAMQVYETFSPGATPREKLIYALTDTMFRNSMVRVLDAAYDAGSPVWSWMCTWENDQMKLRATHAIELSFLWGWIDSVPMIAGNGAPKDLGPVMRAYWASFARTGKPSANGEPEWTPYNTADRPVLVLNSERRVEHDLDGEVRRYWFA
ncbi:MAG: carboxylesterase family protein [Proteobacteria bacterium]|nr:carboxylesterase family protein [Pseudomonadota bacterium]